MAYTIPTRATIEARLLAIYPGAGAAFAGVLFDESMNWILDQANIRYSSATINLVAGQREYDLPNTIQKVESVEYQRSASNFQKIYPVSLDELNSTTPGWNVSPQSADPSRYYIASVPSGNTSKNIIGFPEQPVYNTVMGYPSLVIRGEVVDNLGSGDTLPMVLRDGSALLLEMAARYAEQFDHQNAQAKRMIADRAIGNLMVRTNELFDEAPNMLMVTPTWFNSSRSY